MPEHPSDEELNAFLSGDLLPAERKAVLLHLSRNCPVCRRSLARLARRALGIDAPGPASDYDDALDRAFALALPLPPGG